MNIMVKTRQFCEEMGMNLKEQVQTEIDHIAIRQALEK